jgi:hypothetical protein
MTPTSKRRLTLSLLALALSAPCLADSLASSASSAGSASLGGSSASLNTSSNSSAPKTAVLEGDYRVIQVAVLADRPGMLQLHLQATQDAGGAGTVWLTLPQQALARRGLATGDIVSAHHRPYGVQFAHAARGAAEAEAFFLVLADDWLGELDPRALTL